MIFIQRYNELGSFENNWLCARYHFSFAGYHNPKLQQVGTLLVLNDDTIKANQGFPPHPHRDMEIITFVRTGAVIHKDSLGNTETTHAGNVQVMSAGTGIRHSEYAHPDEDTKLFQIWILPHTQGLAPRYQSAIFPQTPTDHLPLLVSGYGEEGSLFIHQNARIYGGLLTPQTYTHNITTAAYFVLESGEVTLNGTTLHAGDGCALLNESKITLIVPTISRFILVDCA